MQKGFTLLELLIVCAIIGILGAVGTLTFRNAIDAARLNEAAAQLAADLQRARSSAQRSNQNATLEIGSANATSYNLTINGRRTTRTLPANAQITTESTPLTLTYNAPFGEQSGVGAAPIRLDVTLRNRTLPPRYIKIIGVTGKVYLSGYQ